jgi:hypothetical protein
MPLSNAAKAVQNNALGAVITRVSAHSGNPGAAGTQNELSGGTPAYARKAITWNTSTGQNLDSSNQPVFDVPAAGAVRYVGYWNTDGSVFYGSQQVTEEVYGSQGTYTLVDADINLIDA